MKGLFVTGTDTNIGKTVASAALVHRYRPSANIRYWKPIQTGFPMDDDTETVRSLGRCSDGEIWSAGFRFPEPLSPHLAARLAGTGIRFEELIASVPVPKEGDRWIVEGAGGVLVPINEEFFMIDLMRVLGLPVVVVVRSQLGTINHTLLTLEALRSRSICIAGVILVGETNPENARAVERFGAVEILGELPLLRDLNADSLGAWASHHLDPEGRLEKWMSEDAP